MLFTQDDFIIVFAESVMSVIEVKSKLTSSNVEETIMKSHSIGSKIDHKIFNGIFSYENGSVINNDKELAQSIKNTLMSYYGFLNHICFGENIFIRYWDIGEFRSNTITSNKCYGFYKIKELAYGYFISNLICFLCENSGIQVKDRELDNYLFSIPQGKETFCLSDLEIRIDNQSNTNNTATNSR